MINRILIYEPWHSGHHMKYIQLLVRAFSNKGKDLVVASTADSFESSEYKLLVEPYEHLFRKVILDDRRDRDGTFSALYRSLGILRISGKYRCEHVFIPYLDGFPLIGLLSKVSLSAKKKRFEGVIFSGGCSYDGSTRSLRDRMRRWLMQIILSSQSFHRVLFLDTLVLESFRKKLPKANSRIVLCPDPVETDYTINRDDFRTRFRIPHSAKVLGVFGMIDPRKGVVHLLRAFEASKRASNDRLFLMGKHTQEVLECVRNSVLASQIISVDRFVTDDEMVSGINAVDVVAATYPHHVGSASIVIRAAAAGKPVLASDFGWLGHMVEKHGLGKVCDVLNRDSLLEGIRWAFNNPMCDQDKSKVFAEQNSVERFLEVICEGIEQ